jgi:hypothetical protein
MERQRNWTRWALGACVAVVLAGAGIAFVPNNDDAGCWRASWTAKDAWDNTDLELATLQRRLSSLQGTARDESDLERMLSEWELWAAARQASNVAASQSNQSPVDARSSAQSALEACWLARDNTTAVPVDDGVLGRVYRPGALVVRACEEAAGLSEVAWKSCEHKTLTGYEASYASGRSDYQFFGGGCFGF